LESDLVKLESQAGLRAGSGLPGFNRFPAFLPHRVNNAGGWQERVTARHARHCGLRKNAPRVGHQLGVGDFCGVDATVFGAKHILKLSTVVNWGVIAPV